MKIVIIGAGNIATHYAKALYALGHDIGQVYNRTSANAKVLADVVSATAIDNIDYMDNNADLYIIAVSDSHIHTIVEQLNVTIQGIIVHTSGATAMSTLERFNNYGVVYPPQSLNKLLNTDLSSIPFAIEGNNMDTQDRLLALAKEISNSAFICSSEQRLALHVSAVFVNNFPNILFDIAKSILEKENLDFELLKPIIMATAQKVQNHDPRAVQTGPAIRNDKKTISTHLEFLSYSNSMTEIYQILTDFIIKSKQK